MPIRSEASVIRIFSTDNTVVGTGFHVTENTILTCTHVVAAALGIAADTPTKPERSISLDFPLVAAKQLLTAHVIFWQPIQADGSGDITVLQLDSPAPYGAKIARLVVAEDLWGHNFETFGFPDGYDEGVWAAGKLRRRQATGWVQIEDVKETGHRVRQGFSGGAVWDEQLQGVVGMVVAEDSNSSLKAAYILPTNILIKAWPLLGQGEEREEKERPLVHDSSHLVGTSVFISYASQDRERVFEIAGHLEAADVQLWLDRHKIEGGMNYGPEIVQGIKACSVLMLMCSDASMRSRNVKQEIQLAWKYERSYLPLLLEPISFPDQLEYWLEGWQYIEVMDLPPEQWLPQILQALASVGIHTQDRDLSPVQARPTHQLTPPDRGLQGLLSVAKFTDQIWPISVNHVPRGAARSATRGLRGLGAAQDDVQHSYRLGSRVCLVIESDREGYLLLLDEGPEGIIYCLCPSSFAPDMLLRSGRSYLPQEASRYDSFVVTGKPGREYLLAIITDEQPLGLDWKSTNPKIPARFLTLADIETLLAKLHELEGDRWIVLSTYFDVIE